MFWRTSEAQIQMHLCVNLLMLKVTNSRHFTPHISLPSDIVVYVIFFQQLSLIGSATSLEGVV